MLAMLCLAAALVAQERAPDPASATSMARLQRLVEASPLDRVVLGIRVVELATGQVVFDYHGANRFLPPASNTKLFSGAFALAKLGAAYRFLGAAPSDPLRCQTTRACSTAT